MMVTECEAPAACYIVLSSTETHTYTYNWPVKGGGAVATFAPLVLTGTGSFSSESQLSESRMVGDSLKLLYWWVSVYSNFTPTSGLDN